LIVSPGEISGSYMAPPAWQLGYDDVALYRHNDEGPDDMPAHIKSALTQTQLTIPVTDGRIQLGIWQGIFLLEHRATPHTRSLILSLVGE
jgi:secondary thiamine-phosphate synthase enzyme